jgi:hypothetical protein
MFIRKIIVALERIILMHCFSSLYSAAFEIASVKKLDRFELFKKSKKKNEKNRH